MTPEQITAARDRCDKAQHLSLRTTQCCDISIDGAIGAALEFIAHARTDLPLALDAIAAKDAEIAELRSTDWVDRQVARLKELKPGWDSYGGKTPADEALEQAAEILKSRGQLTPCSDGGVQIDWPCGEISFNPAGEQEFDGPSRLLAERDARIAELKRQLAVAEYERNLILDDIANKDAKIAELKVGREALAAIGASLHRGTGSPLSTVQHLGAARTAPVFSDEKDT